MTVFKLSSSNTHWSFKTPTIIDDSSKTDWYSVITGAIVSTFKVIDDDVQFSSEDDYERAFELGVEIDDELKSYILDEYKKMSDKTRMRRFGFFK